MEERERNERSGGLPEGVFGWLSRFGSEEGEDYIIPQQR